MTIVTSEFEYTNQVPPAARPGMNTNVIKLWWDKENNLVYDRRYVSNDGSVSKTPIEHTFNDSPQNRLTADNVAKQIHWGCCGWAAGGHQVWQLKKLIESFIATRPTP